MHCFVYSVKYWMGKSDLIVMHIKLLQFILTLLKPQCLKGERLGVKKKKNNNHFHEVQHHIGNITENLMSTKSVFTKLLLTSQ